MTNEEAVRQLNALDGHDPEIDHSDADLILLAVLAGKDCQDVVDAYRHAKARIGFWYS